MQNRPTEKAVCWGVSKPLKTTFVKRNCAVKKRHREEINIVFGIILIFCFYVLFFQFNLIFNKFIINPIVNK